MARRRPSGSWRRESAASRTRPGRARARCRTSGTTRNERGRSRTDSISFGVLDDVDVSGEHAGAGACRSHVCQEICPFFDDDYKKVGRKLVLPCRTCTPVRLAASSTAAASEFDRKTLCLSAVLLVVGFTLYVMVSLLHSEVRPTSTRVVFAVYDGPGGPEQAEQYGPAAAVLGDRVLLFCGISQLGRA